MNIFYLRDAHLAQLKAAIKNNIEYYKSDEPWLGNYFGGESWSLPSNIHIDEIKLIDPTDKEFFDFENTKIVFNTLRNLTITQASDERLWVYLTHAVCWEYMRLRWPVERYLDKPVNETAKNIRERYFFASKPLVRNGLARLWWYGYVSYDERRDDPFELTKILLSKLDIAQSLLERSFSLNSTITKTILSVLADMEAEGKPIPKRAKFRELSKYINRLGGVTILDALEEDEFKQIVVDKITTLA